MLKALYEGVLSGLFTNIIWAVLCSMVGLMCFLRNRRFRRAVKIKNTRKNKNSPCESIHLFTANPQRNGPFDYVTLENEEDRLYLGYTMEYLACGELSQVFNRKYRNVDRHIYMSPVSFAQGRQLTENLLVIGGPYHNSISDYLLKKKNAINFQPETAIQFWAKDGIHSLVCKAPVRKERLFQKTVEELKTYRFSRTLESANDDYAILMNIIDPCNPQKRLILMMGCGSLGCLGAATFLANQLESVRQARRKKEYIMLISCTGNQEGLFSKPKPELFIEVSS